MFTCCRALLISGCTRLPMRITLQNNKDKFVRLRFSDVLSVVLRTRKHSSRMCTARFCGSQAYDVTSCHILSRGGLVPKEGSVAIGRRGLVPDGGYGTTPAL